MKSTGWLKILGSKWVRVWFKNQVTELNQGVSYEMEEQRVRSLANCPILQIFADSWDGLLIMLKTIYF